MSAGYSNSIEQEIIRQSKWESPYSLFSCSDCKNYKGGCSCEKGVFIAFEGANLYGCGYFDMGKQCRHCGRMT